MSNEIAVVVRKEAARFEERKYLYEPVISPYMYLFDRRVYDINLHSNLDIRPSILEPVRQPRQEDAPDTNP